MEDVAALDCESLIDQAEGCVLKTCLQCQHAKPLVDFDKTTCTRDARTETCRACRAVVCAKRLKKELHHLALDVEVAWERGKICPGCGLFKEARDFARDACSQDKLQSSCRSCKSQAFKVSNRNVLKEGPRHCRKCNELKPASEFYKARPYVCKVCHIRYQTQRLAIISSSSEFVPVKERKCNSCGKVKSAQHFYKSAQTIDGLHSTCRACHISRAQRQYAANKSRPRQSKNVQAGKCSKPERERS